MNKLIIIHGTTASGKSSLSVEVAKELSCSILSADSRQFYKELIIGTAKPSTDDMSGIPHYFIDSHSIYDMPLSSSEFMRLGRQTVHRIFDNSNKFLIVTGGSGMFIDALIDGLHPLPSNSEVRIKLQEIWMKDGLGPLLNELEMKDVESFKTIDINNPMRIIRALEIIRVSGKKMSELRKIPKERLAYPAIRFCINWNTEDLYERINNRVDEMLHNGLFDEINHLPLKDNLLLQNTLGYKEWLAYFDGEATLPEVVNSIKKNTRNYAKRQKTWLRRYPDLIHLDPYEKRSLKDQLITHLNCESCI